MTPQEKPIVIEEMKFSGIFASTQISTKSGQQFIIVLCNGKQIKARNFYPTPDANRMLPGSTVTVLAKEVEFIMSDFQSMFIGSRQFSVSPVATETKKAA